MGNKGKPKGPIWKQPPKVFVPAIPNETNAWVWPALPIVPSSSEQSQSSKVMDGFVRASSDGSSKIDCSSKIDSSSKIDNSSKIESFSKMNGSSNNAMPSKIDSSPKSQQTTFILRYYTNNTVPANGSVWEHPPLPSKTGSIKEVSSELDLGSWTTIPENAKWASLPLWATQSTTPLSRYQWCTKKCPITVMKLDAVKFGAPFKEVPQRLDADFQSWGMPDPIIEKKDPNAPNPWANIPEPIKSKEPFPTLVNWPFTGEQDRFKKLASLGLFVENYKANPSVFHLPKHDQSQSALIRLLQVEGPDVILLKLIWQHHHTASALSRTSQKSWDVLMRIADIWDVTGGNFWDCDKPIEETKATIGQVVIVTPVRDVDGPVKYVDQLRNLHKMCVAIHNFGEFIQNIQFHHVPFLTKEILALVIPEMRKLTILGIYNCELIHLGDGLELLEIITRDRLRGCEHQVSLDFYPAYHVGPYPTHQAGPKKGEDKIGETYSYGVSWDDTGLYIADVRIAIWQEVTGLIKQARIQGIDFVSKHTMFRQWLDKSPCLAVEETLKVIAKDFPTVEDTIVYVNYAEFKGRVSKFRKSRPGNVPNKTEGSQWMRQGFTCSECNACLLGVFYSYDRIRNYMLDRRSLPRCMACVLYGYLNSEYDHYKLEKRTIIKSWCWDHVSGTWNTNDLKKFLHVFAKRTQGKQVRQRARWLWKLRESDEEKGIYHEIDEVQRVIDSQALGRRGHYGIRAATVQDKEAIESGLIDEWGMFREDRINGHGMPRTRRGFW